MARFRFSRLPSRARSSRRKNKIAKTFLFATALGMFRRVEGRPGNFAKHRREGIPGFFTTTQFCAKFLLRAYERGALA